MHPNNDCKTKTISKCETEEYIKTIELSIYDNGCIKLKEWYMSESSGKEFSKEGLITDETQKEIFRELFRMQ